MKLTQPKQFSPTLSAKFAAWYMLIYATMSLMMKVFLSRPHYTGVEHFSLISRLAADGWAILLDVLYIMAGIGILRGNSRAKRRGIVLLIIGTFEGSLGFAWGFAGGPPTHEILLISLMVSAVWHGMWIYLLCRKGRPTPINTPNAPTPIADAADL